MLPYNFKYFNCLNNYHFPELQNTKITRDFPVLKTTTAWAPKKNRVLRPGAGVLRPLGHAEHFAAAAATAGGRPIHWEPQSADATGGPGRGAMAWHGMGRRPGDVSV